jgi:hypothetical protein
MDTASTEKTHILVITYKAGNGRRMKKEYPITTFQATDPAARASAISGAMYSGSLVNWDIKEA